MGKLNYIYSVPVIVPLENAGMGGYGFGVDLDSNFGIKARNTPIPDTSKKVFAEQGSKIVQHFFGKRFKMNPYQFVENSLLVHAICVPGDSCDLALDESGLSDFFNEGWEKIKKGKYIPFSVHYSPHNVDSFQQAQCLRELFLNWANSANLCLNY
jgi:hypothetical protein